MVLLDGACWMCGTRCAGHFCRMECREAWEREIEWMKKAAAGEIPVLRVASIMGLGTL